jgi:hypothetical protein
LEYGLVLLPLTQSLLSELDRLHPRAISFDRSGFRSLTNAVAVFARELSLNGPVAYVETEYFGGNGDQGAAAWDQGRLIYGPRRSSFPGAINQALATLGVRKPSPQGSEETPWLTKLWRRAFQTARRAFRDEFAAVGLGRRRQTDEWATEDEGGINYPMLPPNWLPTTPHCTPESLNYVLSAHPIVVVQFGSGKHRNDLELDRRLSPLLAEFDDRIHCVYMCESTETTALFKEVDVYDLPALACFHAGRWSQTITGIRRPEELRRILTQWSCRPAPI